MKVEFKIDDETLQRAFDGMSAAGVRTDYNRSARKGLSVVRKQAVDNYKKLFKKSKRWKSMWVRNYSRKSRKKIAGAYISLTKLNPQYVDEKKPLILTWLERGTEVRHIRSYPAHIKRTNKKSAKPYRASDDKNPSSYYRGSVPAYHFFKKAINALMQRACDIANNDMTNRIRARAKKQGFKV